MHSERRLVPDDHAASMEHLLGALMDHRPPCGVVHLGAHHGQEVDAYRAAGCERIVLVEANPEHCAVLEERFGGDPDVEVLNYAVAEASGTATLHLYASRSGDTQSASLLPLGHFREVGTIKPTGVVEVPAIRLDDLYDRHGLDPAVHDLLTLDVQGAEVLALRGGAHVLPRLRAVICEVALVELYEGAPLENVVDDLLAGHGYRRLESLYYELTDVEGRRYPAWGDGLFARS